MRVQQLQNYDIFTSASLFSRIVLEMPFIATGAPSSERSRSSTTLTPENGPFNKASVYFQIEIDVTVGLINILVK